MPNNQQNIYIHQNFNRNEIREVLLQNSTSNDISPTSNDKGLLYYDVDIDRIMVWNGNCWKIVKYLDDRDLSNTNDIKLQDIWCDSYELVNLDETTAKSSNPFVEWKSEVLNYKMGTTDFYNDQIVDVVIPKKFSDNSEISNFFYPILEDNLGNSIPRVDNGKEIWRVVEVKDIDDNKINYNIRFFSSPVNFDNQPFTIYYYEYIGKKLDVKAVSGNINKQVYNATSGTQFINKYEVNLLPGLTSDQQILSILLNGVELMPSSYELETIPMGKKLIIDTDFLGYIIDVNPPEDFIHINFLSK